MALTGSSRSFLEEFTKNDEDIMYAPVCVFAFNRPGHLRQTLDALAANEAAAESDVFIFCDGPRNDREKARTDASREVARSASGFKSLTVNARDCNRGLAASIISGVTRIVAKYGTAIVLEDDLVTSPYFLRYMNDGLRVYAASPEVASIHGWCFPHFLPEAPETFFLRGADCWGWATWKRAWKRFEPDAGKLLNELRRRGLTHAFDLDGMSGFTAMLRDTLGGKVDSWAVRWHASAFLAGMYTLYPQRSLVRNIGFDGSGRHGDTREPFGAKLSAFPVSVEFQDIKENLIMRQAQKVASVLWHCQI